MELTDRKKSAVREFWKGKAEGRTLEEICERVEPDPIHTRQLYRWRQKDWFWEEWQEYFDQGMLELLPVVLNTIQSALNSEDVSDGIQKDMARMALESTGLLKRTEGLQEQSREPVEIITAPTSANGDGSDE